MNYNDREHVGIFFGKIDRAPTALDRGADGDDACYPGFSRASKHVIEVRREIRIIEMGVSLDELRVES
jgi:hypothetical protein